MKAFVTFIITSLVLTTLLLKVQLLLDHTLLLFAVFLVVPWSVELSVRWLWTRLLGSARKPDEGGPQC
jgi:hypothetical protein